MSDRPSTTSEPEDHLGMTDEQWAWFQAHTRGFGEQDENGVDVSLLRENLRLTPSQRVEKLLRGPSFAWSGRVMEIPPDFRQLLLALQLRNVRWVLIGGVAMRCHGSQVSTDDLDLCYARDGSNLTALAEALAPFRPRLRGAPEGLPFVLDVRTLRSGRGGRRGGGW